jgi:hypothetical protein
MMKDVIPLTLECNKDQHMNLYVSSIKSVHAADNWIYRARCLKFTMLSYIPTQEVFDGTHKHHHQ